MTSAELNAYLASQGIQANSLNPEVRQALFVVLQSAGKAAVEQMTKLIQAEAARRNLDTITTESAETRAKKEQAAIEAALAEKAKADAARKRRNILIGVGGGLVVLIGGLVWFFHHKRKSNG
jgi:CRISPR/Cas system CSM-associated protein Csm5 (group 7 of RAMP superfamily)